MTVPRANGFPGGMERKGRKMKRERVERTDVPGKGKQLLKSIDRLARAKCAPQYTECISDNVVLCFVEIQANLVVCVLKRKRYFEVEEIVSKNRL